MLWTTMNPANSSGISSKLFPYNNTKLCVFTNSCYDSFICDLSLREGEYTSASNYNSYSDIVDGDRFEIQIRFHRKIDGKYLHI